MHGARYFLDEGKANPMSLILGLEASNVARLVDNASMRVTSSRRPVRVQPSKKSRLVFLTDPTGLAVEQYKILRRRLVNLSPKRRRRVSHKPESWRRENSNLSKSCLVSS